MTDWRKRIIVHQSLNNFSDPFFFNLPLFFWPKGFPERKHAFNLFSIISRVLSENLIKSTRVVWEKMGHVAWNFPIKMELGCVDYLGVKFQKGRTQ